MSAGSLPNRDLRDRFRGGRVADAGLLAAPALAAVLALTALGAVLRFYGLGHQGFWYDEADTAQLVHLSLGKMLGLLPQSESTPPLYYGVAWFWVRIFGDHEAGLRSLSAVAGVLVIPVAYGAAAKLTAGQRPARHPAALGQAAPASSGCRAGVITAALVACSPLLIWYSQEARAYELLVLLTGISLLGFAHARAAPSGRWLAVWAVASALALATHYYALVAVVPEAVWLLADHPRDRRVQIAIGVVVLCGLALLPLATTQNATKRDAWIAHSPLGMRMRQVIPQFLIGTNAPHRLAVKYLAMAMAVVALALLAIRATGAELRPALVAGGLALGGFVLSLLLVAVGIDDLITRNVIALWLPAAILVAGGLATHRAPLLGGVVTVVLCAVGAFGTVGIATERTMQRPDWRYVARALGQRAAGDRYPGRAILIQRYEYRLPLSLYLPRATRAARSRTGARARRHLGRSPLAATVLVGRGLQPRPVADAAQLRHHRPAQRLAPARAPVDDPEHGRPAPGAPQPPGRRPRAAYDVAASRRADLPAWLSASTSSPVSCRWAPAGRSFKVSGPNATRSSARTGCPTASHIRLTWRLRPS